MRLKSTRLFTATMAAAMLMAALSACGLIGGNGNGGGLGDIVVVDDGGSSAPGEKSVSGSSNGGDDDYRESGFGDDDDAQANPPYTSDQGNPQNGNIDPTILGQWMSGNVSGGVYDAVTGRYLRASGTGFVYNYDADGTCWWVMYSSNYGSEYVLQGTGNFTAENGILRIFNRVVEDSNDGGKTYNPKRTLDDYIANYIIELDAYGNTVLKTGETQAEAATDPLPYKKAN